MNRINAANQALFEELVKQIQIQGNAAGIAVAIVDEEGKTQYEQYFGYRDTEQKLPHGRKYDLWSGICDKVLCGFIHHAAGRKRPPGPERSCEPVYSGVYQ